MRIVDRKEFQKLPENTLYCKFQPSCFGDICIKSSSPEDDWGNDFVVDYLALFVDIGEETSQDKIVDKYKVGTEFRWDDEQTSRDGMFEGDEVMFAVYDNQDIEQLIHKLKKCIK